MTTPSTPPLIDRYYAAFNDRRLGEAAALFAPDAVLDQVPSGVRLTGPAGYLEFAELWLNAFPDARLEVESVTTSNAATHEVHLVGRGTHQGPLRLAGRIFRPTGIAAELRLRELLEISGDRIVFASLSFELNDIVRQLTKIDTTALIRHLDRLDALARELRSAQGEEAQVRDVVDRIGLVLDAARNVARPYFK